MGISGKAGNLRGKKIDGGNVFEGPRQQEYPTPPLKHSYASSMFEDAVRRMGYHPYPTPAANLSETYKNPDGITRAGCAYCGHCQRYGCMIGAKAQPTNTLMPVLAKRKNFELRTGSWVRRIVHKDGRATGIQFTDASGEEFFQPAATVVLASFTLNNTRLLAAFENRHALRSGRAQRHAGPQPHAPGGSEARASFSTSRSTPSWEPASSARASRISTATSDSPATKTGFCAWA